MQAEVALRSATGAKEGVVLLAPSFGRQASEWAIREGGRTLHPSRRRRGMTGSTVGSPCAISVVSRRGVRAAAVQLHHPVSHPKRLVYILRGVQDPSRYYTSVLSNVAARLLPITSVVVGARRAASRGAGRVQAFIAAPHDPGEGVRSADPQSPDTSYRRRTTVGRRPAPVSVDVNDPATERYAHRLGTIADTQFREDVLHVHPGGVRTDRQRDGDFLVAPPGRDQLHHLDFP